MNVFLSLLLVTAFTAGPGFEFGAPGLFKIEKAAGDDLAHDIYTITIDAKGRVFVSGPGYIRILHDQDGDGHFESASDFWPGPANGCQGMVFHEGSLYTTGGSGLERYDDKDGDGKADGPPELLLPLSGGEHGAHALRIGPDGFLYFLGGNHCDLPRDRVRGFSPVKDFYAGVFCRMDLRAQSIEVWTDGMRNAYDFDFTPWGDAIGWDSDSERNEGLPWYRPCQIFRLAPGADCGWRGMGTGEVPFGAFDTLAPLAFVNRGSPTGVICIQDNRPASPYRNGILALDWTFGRVYFFHLLQDEVPLPVAGELFLQASSDVSFAPTDIEMAPDGSLLITSGGRGIEGNVYRVVPIDAPNGIVTREPPLRPADVSPRTATDLERALAHGSLVLKRKAAEDAMRLFGTWKPIDGAADDSADAARHLAQAVLRVCRQDDVRLWRSAAAALAHAAPVWMPEPSWPCEDVVLGLAIVRSSPRGALPREAVELALHALKSPAPDHVRSGALRLLCAAFDRMKLREDPEYFTYDPEWEKVDLAPHRELVDRVLAAVRGELGAVGGAATEVARLLAKLRDPTPAVAARIAGRLSESSRAGEDMFTLWCLSQLSSAWDEDTSARVVSWAADFPDKLRRQKIGRDDKWSIFQRGIWERLLSRHADLGAHLVASERFGDAEHIDCIAGASREVLARAAARFLEKPLPEENAPCRRILEFLVESSDAAARPKLERLLRESLANSALRPAALAGLARSPSAEDRGGFLEALADRDPGLLKPAMEGLDRLPVPVATEGVFADEVIDLIGWGLGVDRDPGRVTQRDLVAERLVKLTGEPCDYRPAEKSSRRAAFECWARWLEGRRPDKRAAVESVMKSSVEGEELVESLLKTAPWPDGEAARGKGIFEARACGSCHHLGGAGQRVGPDLSGAAKRLGLRELLTEIVEPSKIVPERYYFTEYALRSGERIQGKEIYSSREALLIVNREGRYRRIDPAEITEANPQAQSLMPAGLLSGLTPAQIADLVAYLKSH